MKAAVLIVELSGGGLAALAVDETAKAVQAAKAARAAGEFDGQPIKGGIILNTAQAAPIWRFKCQPAASVMEDAKPKKRGR